MKSDPEQRIVPQPGIASMRRHGGAGAACSVPVCDRRRPAQPGMRPAPGRTSFGHRPRARCGEHSFDPGVALHPTIRPAFASVSRRFTPTKITYLRNSVLRLGRCGTRHTTSVGLTSTGSDESAFTRCRQGPRRGPVAHGLSVSGRGSRGRSARAWPAATAPPRATTVRTSTTTTGPLPPRGSWR
jgi:hypothetical protein